MRRFAALLSCSAALVASQLTEPAPAALHAFAPTADATVSAAYPKRYFGAAEHLRVRAGRSTSRVYARFNVTGLDGPVSTARLRFYITNGTRNGPAVLLTRAWPSTHITWKRQPTVASGPRADKGRLARGTWVEWDVTPWVTGDGAYSFALRGGSADIVAFASRETKKTDKKPRLIITTPNPDPDPDPNPNPSTVVYVTPTQGATVSGVRAVRVRAPAGTDWIGVYACGGGSVGEDHVMDANGEWSVQWDTQTADCSNGTQDLDTWAFRDDGSDVGNATITVEVNNSSPPPPPDPEPTACQPSSDPGPVEGLGYQLRFSDCFDAFSRSVWCSNQWWEPTPPQGTQYAEDGVLHLIRRRSDGFPNVTVSTEPCGQASPKSFQYGYMEARMKWDTVRGNGPAFWMLSTRHATVGDAWPNVNPYCASHGLPKAQCLSAELDIIEGYGNINGGYPSDPVHDVHTGTLHRNSCGCYNEPDTPARQGSFTRTGKDLSQFHTYAVLWTAAEIKWYFDGVQIGDRVLPFDSTRQPMHLLLYNWNTDWETENMPNASTPDRLDVSVDWVRVWQQ